MPTPELAQSLVLAVASGWMAWLWRSRAAGLVALFGALYLALPAAALLGQALGVPAGDLVPWKWSSVALTGALTAAMVAATRDAGAPVAAALRLAERERAAAELRGRAYALAELCLAGD